jgi:hypothetical protein
VLRVLMIAHVAGDRLVTIGEMGQSYRISLASDESWSRR